MATELKSEQWSAPQLRRRLEPHLRDRGGAATLGDLVAETGLPAERTEPVLRELLDEYNGRLKVDANGELVYSFPHGLRRPETWQETWEKVKTTLWSWFKIAYKIGISIILVTYFVIFLLIMIAMMVAMVVAASSTDSDFDFDFDGCGCSPFDFWLLSDLTASSHRQPRQFQRAKPTPYRPKAKGGGEKVPIWLRVFEFVFGEERPAADALEHERRLLAYLRDNNGRVTIADLVALTGESIASAEETLAHLMVAHGGDVEVSDEGTLIYTFDRLMISAGIRPGQKAANRRWTWWWERSEAPEKLNRNTAAANWGIGLLNGFNLAWSGFFTALGAGEMDLANGLWIFLGPIPFVYSVLFFLIPLVRAWKIGRENEARARRNLLRELARKVFAKHIASGEEPVLYPDEMIQYGREAGDRIHTAGQLKELLDELLRRWDGESEVDEQGRLRYRFDRLRTEWRDGVRARIDIDPAQWQIGDIAYDSADEAVGEDDEWRERMSGEEHGDGDR